MSKLTPKNEFFDMAIQAVNMMAENYTIQDIEIDMLSDGVERKIVTRVIKLCKSYLQNKELQSNIDYHVDYLTKQRNLYEKLYKARQYRDASKALQEHRNAYLYIMAVMENQ